MSTRPQAHLPVIVNGDMTLTLLSQITITQKLSMMSYAVSWAGVSPVGTISVQVSNDYSENVDGTVKNVGTWNILPLTVGGIQVSSVPVTGNTGNGFIDIDQIGGYAIQLVYTPTSGTGTLQAVYNAKVS